jgi:hypothetical protein
MAANEDAGIPLTIEKFKEYGPRRKPRAASLPVGARRSSCARRFRRRRRQCGFLVRENSIHQTS